MNMSGGSPIVSIDTWGFDPPNKAMSSKGDPPRMLRFSRVSVGGESQLEKEQLDADDS